MGSNRTILFFGVLLVLGGALLLAGNLFNFNAWTFCWPVALIVLGVWFVVRPISRHPGAVASYHFIGDQRRSGEWRVVHEDFSHFIGELNLDLSQASIEPGETRLHFSGFVGDIRMVIPADVGVSLEISAFVSNVDFFGNHRDSILSPSSFTTPGYAEAERRLRIEGSSFVAEYRLRQA